MTLIFSTNISPSPTCSKNFRRCSYRPIQPQRPLSHVFSTGPLGTHVLRVLVARTLLVTITSPGGVGRDGGVSAFLTAFRATYVSNWVARESIKSGVLLCLASPVHFPVTCPTLLSSAMKLTASVSLLLATASQAPSIINAAPVDSDPCAAIAGKSHVLPSQALACLKSFPYNETIKSNVISNAERVMDFSSFESFQDSSVRIRDELSRINGTKYEVSLITAAHNVVSFLFVVGLRFQP